MELLNHVFVLLVSASCLSSTSASTCEETETSHVKLDLAKQSIITAKALFPECEGKINDSNCTEKDKALAHLNAALDLISEAKLMCHSCPETKVPETKDPETKDPETKDPETKDPETKDPETKDPETKDPETKVIVLRETPMDCSEIWNKGFKKSGVYRIWPRFHGANTNESIDVYCDMETDGGGWTVIQRRGDFPTRTDFYKDWKSYKNGFGDIQQEFWLGNEKIYALTKKGNYSARFDLVDAKREFRYATYNSFSIGDENSGYVLHIQNHEGNATNDMQAHHGAMFSTKDKQNDKRSLQGACSSMYQSAFWFNKRCGEVNLNGIYKPGVNDVTSIWWFRWKSNNECLYSVEIKIKRRNV